MANNIHLKRLLCFMQHHFLKTTTTTATLSISPSSSSSFTVQYLMNSCGISLETALLTSKKLQLEEKNSQKHESVLTCLTYHEFSDTHIAKLITKHPKILQSRSDLKMKSKMQFLIDIGFEGPLLPDLIVSNPTILCRSLNSHIKPSFEFLKMLLETNERIIAAIKCVSWLLTFDLKGTMKPNIDFLISEGVPISNISKLVMWQPRAILQKVKRMAYAVETVKELGLEPSSPMFVHALRVMVSMSESTWKRKVEAFKSHGWSKEEIMSALKRDPRCLFCSEKNIESKMDFYLNTIKLELAVIIAYPKLLTYSLDTRIRHSLDTRIRPRYIIFKVLKSKKLVKENMKFSLAVTCSEKTFMKKYVDKHLDRVPGLMELYRGTITANKIDIK